MMLKLDNNGQRFIYVAAFTPLCITSKAVNSNPCRGAISREEVIDNAFGFCK
jgi:hypothetical protein